MQLSATNLSSLFLRVDGASDSTMHPAIGQLRKEHAIDDAVDQLCTTCTGLIPHEQKTVELILVRADIIRFGAEPANYPAADAYLEGTVNDSVDPAYGQAIPLSLPT